MFKILQGIFQIRTHLIGIWTNIFEVWIKLGAISTRYGQKYLSFVRKSFKLAIVQFVSKIMKNSTEIIHMWTDDIQLQNWGEGVFMAYH